MRRLLADDLLLAAFVGVVLMVLAVFVLSCGDNARLARVSEVHECGVVYPDAAADAAADVIAPYMPPPGFADASIEAGTQVESVPCVRWAPNGQTCVFTADLDPEAFDLLCEDSLPDGGWCACYGYDYDAGVMLRPCP